MEDVLDPRFFIIYNSTNGDTQNYVLAAVGFVVVFGLILALALFAFGFFGQQAVNRYDYYEPDTYAAYQQGNQQAYDYNNGFQSRSLGSGYDAINVLYMLEEAFRKMEVLEFECQQRLVCEAHEAGASDKYGEVATRLQKIIGSAEPVPEGTEKEIAAAVTAFRDAATHGIQQRDCARTYATKCAKGLREYVSSNTKY